MKIGRNEIGKLSYIENYGNKEFIIPTEIVNFDSAKAFITILSTPSISKIFSEEELEKMQVFVRVSTLAILKQVQVNEKQKDQNNELVKKI